MLYRHRAFWSCVATLLCVTIGTVKCGFNVTLFTITKDTAVDVTYGSTKTPSQMACGHVCALDPDCMSANHRSSTDDCELSATSESEVSTASHVESGTNVVSKRGQENSAIYLPPPPTFVAPTTTTAPSAVSDWVHVFSGYSGSGLADPYEGLLAGIGVNNINSPCDVTDTTCTDDYFNPLMQIWSILNVQKVRVALYSEGIERAYVEFNAQGTTRTSWFNASQILDSSYPSLYNYSFQKFVLSEGPRSFMIRLTPSDPEDCDGVFFMKAFKQASLCAHEDAMSYPQYIYSKYIDGATQSAGLLDADLLTVSIMY